MSNPPFIRKGDKTDHGGTVLTGDGTFRIDGRDVARVGDQVQCPKCRGTFPIISGATDLISGTPVAREGDLTACGAKLIASQGSAWWGADPGKAGDRAGSDTTSLRPSQNDQEVFNDRFRLVDEETGLPLANCEYAVRRGDGQTEYGVTDDLGYVHRIGDTDDAEGIRIELGEWGNVNEQ